MQILKDEIRENIIYSARELFIENGYNGTSMRAIALKVGITVGNLYRYFKNKEAIFDAVIIPALKKSESLIGNYTVFLLEDFEGFKLFLTNELMEAYNTYRLENIMVLSGAEGTKYENVVDQLKEMLVDHVFSQKEAFEHIDLSKEDLRYAISLTTGSFIDVFIKLMIEKEEPEVFRKWISISIDIYFRDIQKRVKGTP